MASASGSYHWSRDGEQFASISYVWTGGDEFVLNDTVTDDEGERKPIRYWLGLECVPCRYRGHRRYRLCPFCRRRCEVLAIAHGGFEWACRRCLSVSYLCQRLAPADRPERRADKLYDKLGGEQQDGLTYRPKRMRWRTFNRIMEQANELAEQADGIFVWRVARMLGMR